MTENLNDKIIIYQSEDGKTQFDVKLEGKTVWLTQAQMVELFQTSKQNVSLHINNNPQRQRPKATRSLMLW
jgi:phosphoribosylaminoimidazolesuccinocarboxamide synthase